MSRARALFSRNIIYTAENVGSDYSVTVVFLFGPLMPLRSLITLNIDGLRADTFLSCLDARSIPNLSALFSHQSLLPQLISAAPSTTFTCQGSIISGAQPCAHRIIGNQYFDRFGRTSRGVARHFGLDVGDTLSYDDAVAVFLGKEGLANQLMPAHLPTIFESVAASGWRSIAIHLMYARGATLWLKPSLLELARFKKGASPFGISPASFDSQVVARLKMALNTIHLPELVYLYFMGLDMTSHKEGPEAQRAYLERVIDPAVGEIRTLLAKHGYGRDTGWMLLSDHGQVAVRADEHHALRLGTPLSRPHRAWYETIAALNRPLHRLGIAEAKSDLVCGPNGGLCHLYLRKKGYPWESAPSFQHEVLTTAQYLGGIGDPTQTPTIERDTLAAILVRDIEHHGPNAPFLALGDEGQLVPLEIFFNDPRFADWIEPTFRLHQLASPECGDIVCLANSSAGYYFGNPLGGMHGGLLTEESLCAFAISAPGLPPDEWISCERDLSAELLSQRLAEGRSWPSLTDIAGLVRSISAQFTPNHPTLGGK